MQRVLSLVKTSPVTVTLTAISLAAHFFPGLGHVLSVDLRNGPFIHLHQIFGCHLLHWSAEHLFWDVGMFAVLGALCERWWPRLYLATLGLSGLFIPLMIVWLQPEIVAYRGLSGIDSALFALLAGRLAIDGVRTRDWMMAGLFAGILSCLAGKIAFEILTGDLLFVSEANFIPLPIAHAIGGGIGVLAARAS